MRLNLEELHNLHEIVSRDKIKTLLQIGYHGYGEILWFDDVILDGYIIVMAQKVPVEQLRELDSNIKSAFTFIDDDSATKSAIDSVSHILNGTKYDKDGRAKEIPGYGKPLDMLYIDGNHDSLGPVRDFVNYSPFVRPGGLVVWQDLNYPNVARQYKEVLEDTGWEHREIISPTNHEIISNGIGVMRKGV